MTDTDPSNVFTVCLLRYTLYVHRLPFTFIDTYVAPDDDTDAFSSSFLLNSVFATWLVYFLTSYISQAQTSGAD